MANDAQYHRFKNLGNQERRNGMIKRDKYLEKMKDKMWNGSVKIITGIRRCGKSYMLNEIFEGYLIGSGVASDHIISVSLDLEEFEWLQNPRELSRYVRERILDDGRRLSSTMRLILSSIRDLRRFMFKVRSAFPTRCTGPGRSCRLTRAAIVSGRLSSPPGLRACGLTMTEYRTLES